MRCADNGNKRAISLTASTSNPQTQHQGLTNKTSTRAVWPQDLIPAVTKCMESQIQFHMSQK